MGRDDASDWDAVYTGIDPFAGTAPTFAVNAKKLTTSGGPQIRATPMDGANFEGALAVVHLQGVRDNHGSAVILAPGLAVTAAHVVEPYSGSFAAGSMTILLVAPRQGSADVWRVEAMRIIESQDIAYLSIQLASDVAPEWTLSVVPVTTRTPVIGDQLAVVGFHLEQDLDGWRGDQLISAGFVSNVYPQGRDEVLAPGPCIEIECGASGGMSGGPVFDTDGRLLGIVQRAWSDGDGPMLASWLLFSMFATIPLEWPDGRYPPGPHAAFDVISEIHGRGRLRQLDARLRYLPWTTVGQLEEDAEALWAVDSPDLWDVERGVHWSPTSP